MCHDQATHLSIELIKQQPGIPELIAERYLPPLPDLQALQQLPEGSLGHCYLLDRIAVGYRLGAKAKPFLAQRWELDWAKPLDVWRQELNVLPMAVYEP